MRSYLNIPTIKPAYLNSVILFTGMLICGYLSVRLGKELNWDLANYHFYNPYALLYNRWGIDYWPTSFIQVNLNPTIDFISYFLIRYCSPKAAVFILGAIHGINIYLLVKIALVFLRELKMIYRYPIAILITALGIYGPLTMPGMGSFQNDNLISIFVLAALLFILQALQSMQAGEKLPSKIIILAGLMLGMGMGLKLTATIFMMGSLVAFGLLPIPRLDKFKLLALFFSGVLIGMLISSGYWMVLSWQRYQNPFFPFFNNIFHSLYFPAINWQDNRFLPKTFWQAIISPFYFSLGGRAGDMPFHDVRLAYIYVLFIMVGGGWCYHAYKHKTWQWPALPRSFIYIFFIASYIAWQLKFSIMRYAVTLEMLAPLIIYLLIVGMQVNKITKIVAVLVVFAYIANAMEPVTSIRMPWYSGSYFNVKLPNNIKNVPEAMVLTAFPAYTQHTDPRPQTYLIPFFPQKWQFVGVPFTKYQYEMTAKLQRRIRGYHGEFFLLAPPAYMPIMQKLAVKLGLGKDSVCEKIYSERQYISNDGVLLCRVTAQLGHA